MGRRRRRGGGRYIGSTVVSAKGDAEGAFAGVLERLGVVKTPVGTLDCGFGRRKATIVLTQTELRAEDTESRQIMHGAARLGGAGNARLWLTAWR